MKIQNAVIDAYNGDIKMDFSTLKKTRSTLLNNLISNLRRSTIMVMKMIQMNIGSQL